MPQAINVELIGVGLPNRGAEFMARTVMANVGTRNVNFISQYRTEKSVADAVGLVQAMPNPNATPQNLDYHTYFDHRGTPYKIDVRIDVSGFSYGDFWGEQKMLNKAVPQILGSKNFQIPYFVLPQSMGPFETFSNLETFAEFVENAKIFCVRDLPSLQCVHSISPWKAWLLPDLCFSKTNGAADIEEFVQRDDYGVIILNTKMLESSSYATKDMYYRDIATVVEVCSDRSLKPVLLNHEGSADRAIIEEVAKVLGVKSFHPQNLDQIVTIIKNSGLLFTSRYHGMISGIKSEVPMVVCGWADKYEGTLSEFFECPPIVEPDFDKAAIEAILEKHSAGNARPFSVANAADKLDLLWKEINSHISGLMAADDNSYSKIAS